MSNADYDKSWLQGVLGDRNGFTPGPTHAKPPAPPGSQPVSRDWDRPGYDPLTVGHATPAVSLDLKDHEIAIVVNELRRIALDYGGSQQLREHIAHYIKPILRGERRP